MKKTGTAKARKARVELRRDNEIKGFQLVLQSMLAAGGKVLQDHYGWTVEESAMWARLATIQFKMWFGDQENGDGKEIKLD